MRGWNIQTHATGSNIFSLAHTQARTRARTGGGEDGFELAHGEALGGGRIVPTNPIRRRAVARVRNRVERPLQQVFHAGDVSLHKHTQGQETSEHIRPCQRKRRSYWIQLKMDTDSENRVRAKTICGH